MADVWHRRHDLQEPVHCYHAFTHYRDMPSGGRTVDGAYRLHRTHCRKLPPSDAAEAPGVWRKWKAQFQWETRVESSDIHLEEETRQQRLEAVHAMNEKHAAIASAMLGKVIQRLQGLDVDQMDPKAVAMWLDKATLVERRARGEATDYVKTDVTGAVDTNHGLSARIMGDPAGVRAATTILAVLSGTAGAPGDTGGNGVAGE